MGVLRSGGAHCAKALICARVQRSHAHFGISARIQSGAQAHVLCAAPISHACECHTCKKPNKSVHSCRQETLCKVHHRGMQGAALCMGFQRVAEAAFAPDPRLCCQPVWR
eukprot:1627044-Pleurochrysis_carterae.AAC.1